MEDIKKKNMVRNLEEVREVVHRMKSELCELNGTAGELLYRLSELSRRGDALERRLHDLASMAGEEAEL